MAPPLLLEPLLCLLELVGRGPIGELALEPALARTGGERERRVDCAALLAVDPFELLGPRVGRRGGSIHRAPAFRQYQCELGSW